MWGRTGKCSLDVEGKKKKEKKKHRNKEETRFVQYSSNGACVGTAYYSTFWSSPKPT